MTIGLIILTSLTRLCQKT